MRVALCIVLLLAATAPAVARPGTCQVVVARAPVEVRAEIERWVAAEPHCVRSIDRGLTRERMVPDASTAGVLVASWMADEHVEAARISDDISNQPIGSPDILVREEQGRRAERMEYVFLASGGALVAGGAVTYLVGRARAKSETLLITPSASAQGVAVGVAGRF